MNHRLFVSQNPLVTYCSQYSERIFGLASTAGDITMIIIMSALLLSGTEGSVIELVAGILFLLANIPLWISNKDITLKNEIALLPIKQRLKEKMKRPLQPRQYPVESFAAITAMGCLVFAFIGIMEFWRTPNFGNAMLILFGLLGVTPNLLQIFAPTLSGYKLRKNRLYSNSSSLKMKIEKWLAYNTEKIVGGLEIPSSIVMITAGVSTGNPAVAAAGVIYTMAYSFYALFVRRDSPALASVSF